MLYVSTRNSVNTYTAYRALHEERTPDGGLFAPQRLNTLSRDELIELGQMSVGERIARVLNIFFPVALTGWDVDFAIGRHPFKLMTMNQKVYVAELWHNLKSDFSHIEKALFLKLCDQKQISGAATAWARITIRIAILAGILWDVDSIQSSDVDIAYFAGDYCFILAAWYAKKMGLPIGRIICTSDEDGGAWDLLHKGEFSTMKNTGISYSSGSNPIYLELLIFELFGSDEVQRFNNACTNGSVYRLDEEQIAHLNHCMDSAVVSRPKITSLIRSIFRTHNYVSDPYMAIAYGGLQNYRSKTGFSRTTLLLSEVSPKTFEAVILEATGISATELKKHIGNN